MNLRLQQLFLCSLAITSLLAMGCEEDGPKLGEVTGTVTLDGKPLEGAVVEFQPVIAKGGSPSYSFNRTDAQGKYKLIFSGDRMGAMVGEHVVRVKTYQQLSTEEGGGTIPEKVPAKYNSESELRKTVEDKDNVIDLELTSE